MTNTTSTGYPVSVTEEGGGIQQNKSYLLPEQSFAHFSLAFSAIGLLANTLLIVVIIRGSLRHSVFMTMLIVLAITDNVELLSSDLLQLGLLGNHLSPSLMFCRIFLFICQSSATMSAWMVVLISVERFIAIFYPLKVHIFLSMKRTYIIISCVGVLICISKVYHLFSSSIFTYSNMTVCYIGANDKSDVIFSIVHGLFYSFIPFCIITVLNVKILKKLKLQQTFRASSQFSTSRDTSLVPMMLAISVAFALTTFPIMILIICSLTVDLAGFKWNLNSNWIFILAIGLVNLNHSLNFFLYCVTGTVFRNAFFSLIKCKASQRSTDSPQQVDTVSSTVL